MAWQTSAINPTTTTPAADISKITNDLQQLRTVVGGGTDADIPRAWASAAQLVAQSLNSGTTSGTGSAYVFAPAQAITAYAAGQSFWITFHAASGASPTLQISGIASPPTLVRYNSSGAVVSIAASEIPAGFATRVTLLSATQALVEDMPTSVGTTTVEVPGFRNVVINGDMAIDQRSGGSTLSLTAGAALQYCVDRMYAYCTGAAATVQQVAGSDVRNRLRFFGNTGVTGVGLGHRVEARNSRQLAGRTATLSVKLSSSSLTSVGWAAYYANSSDAFGSLAAPNRTAIASGSFTSISSTEATYSTQISIPAAATTGIEIVLTGGSLATGATLTIGDLQLERGAVANGSVSFEVVDIGVQLMRCLRYYYKIGGESSAHDICSGVFSATNNFRAVIPIPAMRSAPSCTLVGAVSGITVAGSNTFTPSGFSFNGATTTTSTFDFFVTGATAGQGGYLRTSTSGYLFASAEL